MNNLFQQQAALLAGRTGTHIAPSVHSVTYLKNASGVITHPLVRNVGPMTTPPVIGRGILGLILGTALARSHPHPFTINGRAPG